MIMDKYYVLNSKAIKVGNMKSYSITDLEAGWKCKRRQLCVTQSGFFPPHPHSTLQKVEMVLMGKVIEKGTSHDKLMEIRTCYQKYAQNC